MGREQGEIAKEGGGPAADAGSQRGGAGGGAAERAGKPAVTAATLKAVAPTAAEVPGHRPAT